MEEESGSGGGTREGTRESETGSSFISKMFFKKSDAGSFDESRPQTPVQRMGIGINRQRSGNQRPSNARPPPADRDIERSELQEYLLSQAPEPNLSSVVQLGLQCLEESVARGLQIRNTEMTYYGSLLMEWAHHRGAEMSPANLRKLAAAHYEAWMTRGVVGETEHLTYAKAAYEAALKSVDISTDASVWLEYGKVLMHLGESDQGLKTITSVMRKFEGNKNMSIFYLTAGAMLSSLGKYEQAGQYFFETIQLGLPKFFSKSDLMFILSRSFEQLGFETKTNSSDPVEDGYIMVFSHMVSEKSDAAADNSLQASGESVSQQSVCQESYEAWISSFVTWRDIGDKCVMHGLYSLAADFYGQGLVRDRQAFLKSSLWFKFAKSCFRCGRTSDAQLAVKQAVTLDPSNSQCAIALETWSTYSSEVIDFIEGPLANLIEKLPGTKSRNESAASKIQAFYRGQECRHCWKSKLTPEVRRDLLHKLRASAGLVVGGLYPLLLSVQPNWKGEIQRIRFLEVKTNKSGIIMLSSPFALPLKQFDARYTYELRMSCGFLRPVALGEESKDDSGQADHDLYLVTIQFREKETGFYVMRQLHLSLDPKGNLTTNEVAVDVMRKRNREYPSVEPLSSSQGTEDDKDQAAEDATVDSLHSLFDRLRSRKGCYRHFGLMFMYRAFLETSPRPPEILATPSAAAVHAASPRAESGALKVILLEVRTNQRFVFTVPIRMIGTLDKLSQYLPLLVLCLNHVRSHCVNVNETPQNVTVPIYNEKMSIGLEVFLCCGNITALTVHEPPDDKKVARCLDVFTKQDHAFTFLQSQVADAFDYDAQSLDTFSMFSDSQSMSTAGTSYNAAKESQKVDNMTTNSASIGNVNDTTSIESSNKSHDASHEKNNNTRDDASNEVSVVSDKAADASVEGADEKSIVSDKAADASVEGADEKSIVSDKMVDEKSIVSDKAADASVEGADEKSIVSDKAADASVEGADEKSIVSDKAADASVEGADEKSIVSDKAADASVEGADEKSVVSDKAADASVEGADEKPLVSDKAADEKSVVSDKGADASVEGADEKSVVSDKAADVSVEGADDKLVVSDKGADEKSLVSDKGADENSVVSDKRVDEKSVVSDKGADASVEGADEKSVVSDKGADISVEGADDKSVVSNKGADEKSVVSDKAADTSVEGADEKSVVSDKGADASVEGADEKSVVADKGADISVEGADDKSVVSVKAANVTVEGADGKSVVSDKGADISVEGADGKSVVSDKGADISVEGADDKSVVSDKAADASVEGADGKSVVSDKGADASVEGVDVSVGETLESALANARDANAVQFVEWSRKGALRHYGCYYFYNASLVLSGDCTGLTVRFLSLESEELFLFKLPISFGDAEKLPSLLPILAHTLGTLRTQFDDILGQNALPYTHILPLFGGKLELPLEVSKNKEDIILVTLNDTAEKSVLDEASVAEVLDICSARDRAYLYLDARAGDAIVEAEILANRSFYEEDPEKLKEYEAIKLSDELEEERLPFVYQAPQVDHNNITLLKIEELSNIDDDPYVSMDEIQTYRTAVAIDEIPVRQPVNVQAAIFLAFQGQRLEAMDYLMERAAKAKHEVTRRNAHAYLKERVEAARLNPVPAKRRISTISSASGPIEKQESVISPQSSEDEEDDVVLARSASPPIIDVPPSKGTLSRGPSSRSPLPPTRPKLKSEGSRRGSVPMFMTSAPPSRRRQSISPLVPMPSEGGDGLDDALELKLKALLDQQLKDEKFTENPSDLVDTLKSFTGVSVAPAPVQDDMSAGAMSRSTSSVAGGADSPPLSPNISQPAPLLSSLPSQKVQNWESKMATMKSMNQLSTIGKGKRNPVDFLHASDATAADSEEPMFDESILSFLQMGYSTGTCAYLAIWKSKLRACLRAFSSPAQLDKAIHSLQRAYPEPLTRAGAFCALAQTSGSVGEALGQLNDKTFKHELVLVCQALPVDEIIQKLADFMKKQKYASVNTLDSTFGDSSPSVASVMRNTQIMRSDSNPDRDGELDDAPNLMYSEDANFPSAVSRTLPHHGMKSNSSSVISRGSLVKRLRNSTVSKSASSLLPPIETMLSSTPKKPNYKLGTTFPSLTTPKEADSRRNFVQSCSVPSTYSSHSNDATTPNATRLRKAQGTGNKAQSYGGTAPPKFTRVGKTIDMLADEADSLVVMSRLEAYRAKEEELLLKYHPSPQSYFRSTRQKKTMELKTKRRNML